MSKLTEEQFNEVVDAIFDAIPDNHYGLSYFGAAIEDNELQHLFTEEEMSDFHNCELTYQAQEDEYGEYDSDEDDDEDSEDEEDNSIIYEVRRSYPWSSGSWIETNEEELNKALKEEVARIVKLVINSNDNKQGDNIEEHFCHDCQDFVDTEIADDDGEEIRVCSDCGSSQVEVAEPCEGCDAPLGMNRCSCGREDEDYREE